jgi:hypothetical protein
LPTLVEVEDAVVQRVKDQLANAQQALVALVERSPVPVNVTPPNAAFLSGYSYPGHRGTVKVYEGASAWWGHCSYGSKENPVAVVEAHMPYTSSGSDAVSTGPTQDELARETGLPFVGGGRPLRLTIWNPDASDLKRSMEHNPDGTVIAKIYYSVDGWGGISSGFLAVRADGTYRVGMHG